VDDVGLEAFVEARGPRISSRTDSRFSHYYYIGAVLK
jgi:hypothetical protein